MADKKKVKKEQGSKTDNNKDISALEKRVEALEEKNETLANVKEDLAKKNKSLKEEMKTIKEKVDNTDDVDELKKAFKERKEKEIKKKMAQREEELKEKEEKLNQLTLKNEIDQFVAKKPHLESLVNDLVSTVDINNIDELKSKITPEMEDSYKLAHQVKKKEEEAGSDPLEDYDGKVVTKKEKKKIRYEKRLKARREGKTLREIAKIK